jgi:hypothetical protein
MAKIDDAMVKLPGFPGYMGDAPKTEEDYESLQWLGEWTPSKPTWIQVQEQLTLILKEDVKDATRVKLAKTDWAVLPDVGISNVAEFEAYRAALREIIKNPVLDPEYPTEPNPVWI